VLYDYVVRRRQILLMSKATRSNAILSSLFPAQVRERLMDEQDDPEAKKKFGLGAVPTRRASSPFSTSSRNVETGAVSGALLMQSKPIADLFPSATVMFADIAGFTAWSSTRDPAQVFTLLEQIYSTFDAVAKKRKVFKVETIGDCYVACAGLPEPDENHAEVVCKFAMECRVKMNSVVRRLEVVLGPDTSDLAMRFGIHSGAVTAGVLRGEKVR
jgi:class 3 adenylate cyclase